MNSLGDKSRLLACLVGREDISEQAETLVWEPLNLLQEEVSQGQEEMKVVQDGLEELLRTEEKEDVTLMGKNLEKLAKAFKKSIAKLLLTRMVLGSLLQSSNFVFNFSQHKLIKRPKSGKLGKGFVAVGLCWNVSLFRLVGQSWSLSSQNGRKV